MQKIIELGKKYPLIVILLIIAASVISIIFLPNLWIDSSTKSMMMALDPDIDYYQETIKIFGSDTLLIVYVKDENLFTPHKLAVLEKLVSKLSDESLVPHVQRTESLYSANNLKGYAGLIDNTPLMDYPPETEAAAREILQKALNNPVLLRNLISADGTITVINLYLKPSITDERDSEAETAKGVARVLQSKIDENNPESKTFDQEFDRVFQIGAPYIRDTLTNMITSDMTTLLPLAFAVLMIMLIITMGSLNGASLPFLTSMLSILFTFGFMGACNLPFNILTFIVPVLVIVIGSTEDAHILAEYREGLQKQGKRKLAISFMARAIGTSIFLTALTTFLGFLSIALNRVIVLIQFGLIAGFALFINPLVTFLVSPVYLRFFGTKTISKKAKTANFITRLLHNFANKLSILVKRHKTIIFIAFLGCALVIGIFSIRINVDNDTVSYFKQDSELINRMQIMHRDLSGAITFFVRINRQQAETLPVDKTDVLPETEIESEVETDLWAEDIIIIDEFTESSYTQESEQPLETGEKKRLFQDPHYMRLLADIQHIFDTEYNFDKTISIANFIRMIHKELNVDKPCNYDITPDPDDPTSQNLIAQYAQLLHNDDISSYITTDWNQANIMVRHNISSSEAINKMLNRLNNDLTALLKACDPSLTFRVTGENILANKAADSIAVSQVSSLGLLLITILIIMSILFTNIKAGLLSLIPNLFPVAILFGIMGIFRIPLNIGTCMVAAVAIGISADDTIHFMTRFNKEMRNLQERDRAVTSVIRAELRPILSTSIALAMGFSILVLSSLIPIIYFGLLTAMVMICALLADLMITPVILTSFQLINLTDIARLKLARGLRSSPLFSSMSMFQIKKFVLMGHVMHRQKGEYVIKRGDEDQKMYVLLTGKVKVERKDHKTGKILYIATLGIGDVFGEISLLRKAPRSANIVAQEAVSYLSIDWKGIRRIQKSSRSISLKLYLNLARILSQRLVHTTDLLQQSESK